MIEDRTCILGVGTSESNAIEAAYGDVKEGRDQLEKTHACVCPISRSEFMDNL